ncbi:MAG TPA: RpiB/LacA/LacB family sugar-phosphate isomerase [Candidatus Nitrosotalea sp.]|nr:RpiB/LacA/LacB family sugar-phosphate isomerase [Candidatus Nitrosotalea sp.]
MRIAIGCDDTGFPLKEPLVTALEAEGHDVLDLGTFSTDPVDYPDYARAVGQAVLRGFVDASVLLCGSGAGGVIAANKMRGIRAALCHDAASARRSREEVDANVLCLAAADLDSKTAVDIVQTFIATQYEPEDQQTRRMGKIGQLEAGLLGADKAPLKPGPGDERSAGGKPQASKAAPKPTVKREAAKAEPPAPVTAPEPAPAERPSPPPVTSPPLVLPDPLKLPAVEETLRFLEAREFLDRLWVKDATLWKGDAATVRNRLGWLTSPTIMRGHSEDIRGFADEVRRLQYSHVVLLGMGGSSSTGEVFNESFGSKMGFPDMLVLDSTDPGAVKHVLESINLSRALFVVASKSGTSAETMAAYAFFRGQVEAASSPRPGMQFVAITDPGRPLDKLATETGFRRTFLNPASIGGRYSALSFFGLVPAAMIGVDIKILLERAHTMVETCGNEVGVRGNPAVQLGAVLAGLARAGRDKVTLVMSEKIRGLGRWIEQLLAESLGKDGTGLVPVVDEPLGAPTVYGDDRVFVSLVLEGDDTQDAALAKLADAGHPVLRLVLRDPMDLGAEFFRWELATATAGAVLGVNPFDEPDVARAKENAGTLLTEWRRSRRLPEWPSDVEEDGIVLMTKSNKKPGSVSRGLAAHLAMAAPGDYLAIQAYLTPTVEAARALQEMRIALRDRLRIATTVGWGPRYLHSTGQLHKGGPSSGLFIQITGEDREDLAIPGAGYGFSTMKSAQALGDLQSLRDGARRVIRLHLTGKQSQTLQQLLQMVSGLTKRL